MSSIDVGRRDFIHSAAWMSAALMAGECLGGRLKVTGPNGAPMQGFALKPMKQVRVACIGVGSRGTSALRRISQVPGTVVTAVADLFQHRVDRRSRGSRSTASRRPPSPWRGLRGTSASASPTRWT